MLTDLIKLNVLHMVRSFALKPDTITSTDDEYTLLIPVPNGRFFVNTRWNHNRAVYSVSYFHSANGSFIACGMTEFLIELKNQIQSCLQFAETQPYAEPA